MSDPADLYMIDPDGGVTLPIGEGLAPFRMRPSYRAMIALEKALGRKSMAILGGIAKSDLSLEDLAIGVHALLVANGCEVRGAPITLEHVQEEMIFGRYAEFVLILGRFLSEAVSGGRAGRDSAPKKKADAGAEVAEAGPR